MLPGKKLRLGAMAARGVGLVKHVVAVRPRRSLVLLLRF